GCQRYEDRFPEKDAAGGDQSAKIAKQCQSIEAQVTARLYAEHQRIAGDASETARRSVDTDLRQKDQQLAELRQVLRQHDEKLAEAQADLIRKERELTGRAARRPGEKRS